MKNIVVATVLLGITFSGCMEKSPIIHLGNADAPAKAETTYVADPLPAAQLHNVLIEDFTGIKCPSCPNAHVVIANLEAAHPGRINAIGMYFNSTVPQSQPYADNKYDFRTAAATEIANSVYQSISQLPNGGIDRKPLGTSTVLPPIQCDYRSWNFLATSNLDSAEKINLSVASTFDPATQKVKIKVTVTYLEATSVIQNLSVAIVEDSLIDKQEIPGGDDLAYHFSNVLRDMITTVPYGDLVAPKLAVKEKGLVYEVTYNYAWKAAWNPANCRVIAFVTRGDASAGAHVYQSVQARIKP